MIFPIQGLGDDVNQLALISCTQYLFKNGMLVEHLENAFRGKFDISDILTRLRVKQASKRLTEAQHDMAEAHHKLVRIQKKMVELQLGMASAQQDYENTLVAFLDHSLSLLKVRIHT